VPIAARAQVAVRATDYAGELEDSDVEEAEEAAWNAGSDLPDEMEPGPRGTRDERVAAWKLGYDECDPIACLA
jgi:predicted metalloprotease